MIRKKLILKFDTMIIGIPKETQPSEKRVAIAPDNIAAFAMAKAAILSGAIATLFSEG